MGISRHLYDRAAARPDGGFRTVPHGRLLHAGHPVSRIIAAEPFQIPGDADPVAGALSALLANDIVCLAAAPVLVEGCGRRGLNPVPFPVGLACASNVGSAATLIGNPQNMLIAQVLDLSFS